MQLKRLRKMTIREMVVSYPWLVVVLAVLVCVALIAVAFAPPAAHFTPSCSIQPLLPCVQPLLAYNATGPLRYSVLFHNDLGQPMYLPAGSFNITVAGARASSSASAFYIGNCTPSMAQQGSYVLCTAYITGGQKFSPGTQEEVLFTLSYELCGGSSRSTCSQSLYISTGQSLQAMAQSGVTFHSLIIETVPTTGAVDIGGVSYVNGADVVLLNDQYQIFPVVPAGYSFSGWKLGGSTVSSLSSASSQNATINLQDNATLIAVFNSVQKGG
jgi:hypothetical protein